MKTWVKKIFGFGLASLLSDLSHEMTISLVPIIVGQFVAPTQVPLVLGIISSFTDAFASFLRLVSGYISDIMPRKKPLIAFGYFMSGFFSAILGYAQSIWQVLIYRVLSFTGSGLREPPRDALIATLIPSHYYGRAFGLRAAMDTIGALLGPLIAFLCTGIFSVKTIFLISFIPGMLSVAAILFLTEDRRIHIPRQRITIATVWHNFTLLPRPFIIFTSLLFIFDLANFNKLLLLARAQQIVTVNATVMASTLVFLYACFNVTRIWAEFSIGWLSDYVNRVVLLALFGCASLTAVGFLLMASQASLMYCIFVFVLSAISAAAVTTLKKACAADMLPLGVRGLGFGTLQASEGIAALIANALLGYLWTYHSPYVGFGYVVVLSCIAAALLLLFAWRSK